jgi:hypothetical protein
MKSNWRSRNVLLQRFSTWGTRTPGGTQADHRGYASSSQGACKIVKTTQKKTIWVEFLIRGYAERNNFDLGVRKYQKVENPCFIGLKVTIKEGACIFLLVMAQFTIVLY